MVAIGASFGVVVTWCHCCCQLCFLCGHGCLPPLLLLVMVACHHCYCWSWLLATIAIVGHVSFMVMVPWCQQCYCFLFCGCGQMSPSMLLTFPLWSWLHGTIVTIVISFMAMATWHHPCCCLLHDHGCLVPSLLLLLLSWSWLPNAIVATIATFVVMLTLCHHDCYSFFHNHGCLTSSCYCCSCFQCHQ